MSSIPCSGARQCVRPISYLFISIFLAGSVLLDPHAVPTANAQWSGTVTTENGLPMVRNPATPMQPPITVPLHQQWRRGADESEEVIFGLLNDIAIDDDGTVYALDMQLCEIQVFAPDGEYLRTIGRRGEGPGEFSFPRGLFITPEGLIGVVQSMPGKIVMLTPEGDAADNYPLPESDGMFAINAVREAGGRVFLHMRTTTASDNNQVFHDVESIVRLTPQGKIDATMARLERDTDFSRLVFDEKKMTAVPAWAGADDGIMYVGASFDDYRINVWDPSGKQVRTFEREYKPRVRNDDERRRRGPLVRVSNGQGNLETKVVKSETDRAIIDIFPRANGVVWVLSSHGAFDTADGELCVLDEFDAEGRFVRQIHLMGAGNLDTDFLVIRGNRVFVLTDRESARYALMAQDSGDDTEDAAQMTLICSEIDSDLTLKN